MAAHRFYYTLKPYLPRRVRMALRQFSARRTRAKFAATWPIDREAGKTPANWIGWPEGKKFAFILTHDVEGPDGLEKCRKLAELDMEHGFRGSFNFIPEGPYTVPPSLRAWLTGQGFEVGVHDLHHDGKLYHSRDRFIRKAQRINQYLSDWNATGFRSGFMLRNLEWMQELRIDYDSSTFDTDPFEPQSEGAGTIFPFWIPAGSNGTNAGFPGMISSTAHRRLPSAPDDTAKSGYVELPYTLPQDSTLFLVLGENSADVWLRKLEWIAAQGGMALVNVHPDYIRFPGEKKSSGTYDSQHYIDLLKAVLATGGCWQPLPHEAARYARRSWNHSSTPFLPLVERK